MIGQHPKSTPFPYTTLFRSPLVVAAPRQAQDEVTRVERALADRIGQQVGERSCGVADVTDSRQTGEHAVRSEEHTSELQSRQYLVCRLLLEKKKNIDTC